MGWTKSTYISVLKKLLLEESGQVSWSAGDLLTYLNLAITETIVDTQCKTDTDIIEVYANKNIYNLPSNMLSPLNFLFNGIKMKEETELELLKDDYTGSISANINKYAILDHNRIQVKPRPENSGDAITETSDYGVIAKSVESGLTITETSEYGVIARTTFSGGGKYYMESTQYGVIAQETKTENNIVVWGVIDLPDLVNDSDEADLPAWINLGVCYKTLELLYSELGDKLSEIRRVNWENKYAAFIIKGRRVRGKYTPKSNQGLKMKINPISNRR